MYAGARPGQLSAAVRGNLPRVYVPNSGSGTVDVIDPATYKIVDHFKVGREPQHVTPSYDLKSLWVLADKGDSLTRIDPVTGHREQTVPVADPYNMYYTPDGRYAIVVAERKKRLDFRDAHTMALVKQVPVPCRGVDHMDFSASGRFLIASCEFSGQMVKVDVLEEKMLGTLKLPGHSMPQDVRLSPDGSVFFVADMASNGVYVIDGDALRVLTFLPTGRGTHGLYFSRDSRWLYASNRGEGSISVIDVRTRTVATVWHIPGEAAPIWAESPRTAASCGSPAATIPRSTRSTRQTGGCSRGSPWAGGLTACVSGRSRVATVSVTPASCADRRQPDTEVPMEPPIEPGIEANEPRGAFWRWPPWPRWKPVGRRRRSCKQPEAGRCSSACTRRAPTVLISRPPWKARPKPASGPWSRR